jgi:hypothetical protein
MNLIVLIKQNNKNELKPLLDLLQSQNIDDFVSNLYASTQIALAFFDSEGGIMAVCNEAKLCKCYYDKFGGETTYCSLFVPTFTASLIKGEPINKLCDNNSRVSSQTVNIEGRNYSIAMFQYLLTSDVIAQQNQEDNDKNKTEKIPAYQWKPVTLSLDKKDMIFDYAIKVLKRTITA